MGEVITIGLDHRLARSVKLAKLGQLPAQQRQREARDNARAVVDSIATREVRMQRALRSLGVTESRAREMTDAFAGMTHLERWAMLMRELPTMAGQAATDLLKRHGYAVPTRLRCVGDVCPKCGKEIGVRETVAVLNGVVRHVVCPRGV